MAQVVGFLPLRRSERKPAETAERALQQARKVLRTYAYTKVETAWDGWYDARPGLYFVLEGHEHAIESTFERLASGLHFAHKLWTLQ